MELSYLSTIYTNSDIVLINKRKRRTILINLLLSNTYDYLNSNLLLSQKTLDASIRPEEVIRKYIQLQQISANDSRTLEELQKEKILLSLEGEKNKDPWELVSRPFVNQLPVAPRRNRITAFVSLLGLVFGIFVSLIIDKRKDIIFSKFKVNKVIPLPILMNYNLQSSNSKKSLQLLFNSIFLSDNYSNLGLITIKDVQNSKISSFSNFISTLEYKKEVKLIDNVIEIDSFNKFILIIPLGSITTLELSEFYNSIRYLESNLIGIITLE